MLHAASLTNEGPLYYVGQGFTSARMTRRERLNIEESGSAGPESPMRAPARASDVQRPR